MKRSEDPFIGLPEQAIDEGFAVVPRRDVSTPSREQTRAQTAATIAPAVARLHGFDALEQPLISGLAMCPGRVLSARSIVSLRSAMVGRDVVVLFDCGDAGAPIIIGMIEPKPLGAAIAEPAPGVTIRADDERHVVTAEREIVLRCGDASITLTRAGKVIIKGNYILSRSTGYNKIKGAAIDIN